MVCAIIALDAKNGRGPPGFYVEIKIAYVHDFALKTPKQQPGTRKPLDLEVHTQFWSATLVI